MNMKTRHGTEGINRLSSVAYFHHKLWY
ncbi:hypothetical protein E2C01_053979 [Portunus trituberculatus]|uniref:Uncharacterized protein n=1 Tax=Portunus trituberculatus TaxID=210409 RepID=A0A5B7GQS2_PORTR|nr:hypothetical protein [Portunus trituberculatus]